jgi:hypothetical protein
MQAQLPEEEVARLKALLDCHVLDTPPEELFDQTARLAAYLCGTPIVLIGFIDATRQWFKSRVGWDYPEVPREHSICEQTILHRDLLVIPDAAADKRFSASPMVIRVGIRFYAGAPLLTKEGYALGTLSSGTPSRAQRCSAHAGSSGGRSIGNTPQLRKSVGSFFFQGTAGFGRAKCRWFLPDYPRWAHIGLQ